MSLFGGPLSRLIGRRLMPPSAAHCHRVQPYRPNSVPSTPPLARDRYDVVVVGGGMLGSTAALALALEEKLERKRILVLDQTPGPPSSFSPSQPFNLRVINLTVGNAKFLDTLGVWDRIRRMRYHTYDKIVCWERHSSQTIEFEESPMGFIVENEVLERGVWEVSEGLHNIDTLRGVQVEEIVYPKDNSVVTLQLNTGQTLTADLIVGADGQNSYVRRVMDTPMIRWEYQQQGVVCVLESADGPRFDNVAFQRFLSTGPIALLPLGQGLFSLVWSCRDTLSSELASLSDEEFVSRVNNALQRQPTLSSTMATVETLASQLGLESRAPDTPRITGIVGKRGSYPLGFHVASRLAGPRMVLVGDAAQRVHPLAGQGANIGFRDIQRLCREVGRGSEDIGDVAALNRYETYTQRHNAPMLAFLDGMNKLYSTSTEPVVLARNLGLGLVNQMDFLKKIFVSNARS